jgi:hypothetical protein
MPMFVKLEVTSAYEVKENINEFGDNSIIFFFFI